MAVGPETPIELIDGVYATLDERVGAMRSRIGHSLTLSEKILANHLDSPGAEVERGVSYVDFRPDRVAMQDATAQMAWLQFDTAGLAELTPGQPVTVEVSPPGGDTWSFPANHTFSPQQIEWFKAGSALNVIRRNLGK